MKELSFPFPFLSIRFYTQTTLTGQHIVVPGDKYHLLLLFIIQWNIECLTIFHSPTLLPYFETLPFYWVCYLYFESVALFIPICIAYSLFIFCSSPRKLFKRITPYFQSIGPYSLIAVSSAMVPWLLSYSAQNSTSLQVSAYITTILVGVNAIQMIPRRWSYHYLQRRTDEAYQEFRKKLFLFLSLNLIVAIGITLSIEATAVVSVYVLASMLSLASSNKLMFPLFLPSSLFTLPSSLFPLPSALFALPSSIFQILACLL